MPTPEAPDLVFTTEEIETLGRTADALSAYLGRAVLAEIVGAEETGFEWVIFAMPLDKKEDESEFTVVQVGGDQARILGNRGGLDPKDNAVYACRYLWAIQLSDAEPVRFIKVDEEGEEVAWTETLEELLPFALSEDAFAPEDDTDEEDDEDDDDSPEPGVHGHTLH
ncbi:hypothetical protein ACMTAU_05415 [Alcaligenes pakistanensis]